MYEKKWCSSRRQTSIFAHALKKLNFSWNLVPKLVPQSCRVPLLHLGPPRPPINCAVSHEAMWWSHSGDLLPPASLSFLHQCSCGGWGHDPVYTRPTHPSGLVSFPHLGTKQCSSTFGFVFWLYLNDVLHVVLVLVPAWFRSVSASFLDSTRSRQLLFHKGLVLFNFRFPVFCRWISMKDQIRAAS